MHPGAGHHAHASSARAAATPWMEGGTLRRVQTWLMVPLVVVIALESGCGGVQRGPAASQTNADLFPTLLTARAAWTGETRAAKLRVWADEGYRAQNPQWQEGLDEYVAYANRVLIPMLGVGLVPEYRAWEHRASGEL